LPARGRRRGAPRRHGDRAQPARGRLRALGAEAQGMSGADPPSERHAIERIVGRARGRGSGPTLLVVSAIHGNEPAGVRASRNVLKRVADERLPLRGEMVCIVGNVGAAKKGVRYQVKDLNRAWTDARVDAL